MKLFICGIAVALCVSCASLPLKQKAVLGLQASEVALEAAHDAERSLCSSLASPTMPVYFCDNPAAVEMGLSGERHQLFARLFSKAFDAQSKAALVLMTWRVGEAAPTSIGEYVKAVQEILTTVLALLPTATNVVDKAKKASIEAQHAANLVGAEP